MVRVLLVVDDYNEMIYLQTVLKKIGFDVEALNSTKKYTEASLGFNPQVVVGSIQGQKVDIMHLAKEIRRNRGLPKFVGLRTGVGAGDAEALKSEGLDLVLETPVNMRKLILGMTQLMNVDDKGFIEKLHKIQNQKTSDDGDEVAFLGSLDQLDGDPIERLKKNELQNVLTEAPVRPDLVSGDQAMTRSHRYSKFLETHPAPKPGRFQRQRILEFNKLIRAAEKPDDLEEIEDQRKKFVKAMFKKP
jgi:CheY-like chemotaxis protein